MSVYGIPGSATYAVAIGSLSGMLDVLPDNASNQIDAQSVRDVVAGLWDAIVGLSQSIGGQSNVIYNNPNPSSIPVGGISVNSTFNNQTVQQVFDNMFYPYVQPVISLSVNPSSLELGNSSATVQLSWSIQAKKNNIVSAVVNTPNPVSVTTPVSNSNASGVLTGTPTLNVTSTFTFSVNDFNISDGSGTTYQTTTSVSWRLKRYWGKISTFGALTSAQVISLDGAGVGSGSELATSRVQNRDGINGAGQYLVFAWPTSFGEPSFVINGLPNTAFTKVNNNFSVTNSFGYSVNYNVYMSNTAQNSPISQFQIN
jgi:hypothetical protein